MLDLINKHNTNTAWDNQEELEAVFDALKLSDQRIEEIATKRELSEEAQAIEDIYKTYPWLHLDPQATGDYVMIRCTVTVALQPAFRRIRERLEKEGYI